MVAAQAVSSWGETAGYRETVFYLSLPPAVTIPATGLHGGGHRAHLSFSRQPGGRWGGCRRVSAILTFSSSQDGDQFLSSGSGKICHNT